MALLTNGQIRPFPEGSNWAKAALLALYALWLLIVGQHHEPWFDEAQAWLIARDSSVIDIITEHARYEGTPPLWHLLLWVAMRCGLVFSQIYFISIVCAVIGAGIVLWRAPFPLWMRALIILSYFSAYQFAVVARSYALDLMLLPAVAALFASRLQRPIGYAALIGILALCNAYSFLVAAVLGAELLVAVFRAGLLRNPRHIAGLGIAAFCGLATVAMSWQPADNGFLQPEEYSPTASAITFVAEAFVDRIFFWSATRPSAQETVMGFAASLILLLPFTRLIAHAGMRLLAAALFLLLITFSAAAYASPWHAGILFYAWIMMLWFCWPTLRDQPKMRRDIVVSTTIILAIQAVQGVSTGAIDIARTYSAGPSAARVIEQWRSRHPTDRIAGSGFKAFAVQPYFPGNIFANYFAGAPRPSYIVWTKNAAWRPFNGALETQRAAAKGYEILILSSHHVDLQPQQSLRLGGRQYAMLAWCQGHMLWKGYARENDSIAVVVRQPRRFSPLPEGNPCRLR